MIQSRKVIVEERGKREGDRDLLASVIALGLIVLPLEVQFPAEVLHQVTKEEDPDKERTPSGGRSRSFQKNGGRDQTLWKKVDKKREKGISQRRIEIEPSAYEWVTKN